ncbi:site-specific integrase, partial [Acinetobacter baumannii]|uniref:site-specific integrase n=1 Tax=Acinetobacter baumannii TaxID=470 RepID=UPI000FEDA1E3
MLDREILLKKWLDEYLLANKSNETTYTLKNSLNLFFEYTNLALEEIEASDIRTFIAYRAQNGVGVSTLKKNISAIRTFFHYLTKEKLINFNPAEDIKIKKSSKVLH